MHRPIYTSSTAGVIPTSVLRVAEDLQQALESAFVLYQVPMSEIAQYLRTTLQLFVFTISLSMCMRAEVTFDKITNCMQVDVTFAGHDHKYERTCPVYMKSCLAYDGNGTAGGPMHVVRSTHGKSIMKQMTLAELVGLPPQSMYDAPNALPQAARALLPLQVIGNAGYKLSWAADPSPADYWMNRAIEHGFLRCNVNGTSFACEVGAAALLCAFYMITAVDLSSVAACVTVIHDYLGYKRPGLAAHELTNSRAYRPDFFLKAMLHVQEVGSMTGRVLDSWTLRKPANWAPDYNVRNLFTSYFISNYTTSDFLESTGMSLICHLGKECGVIYFLYQQLQI